MKIAYSLNKHYLLKHPLSIPEYLILDYAIPKGLHLSWNHRLATRWHLNHQTCVWERDLMSISNDSGTTYYHIIPIVFKENCKKWLIVWLGISSRVKSISKEAYTRPYRKNSDPIDVNKVNYTKSFFLLVFSQICRYSTCQEQLDFCNEWHRRMKKRYHFPLTKVT